MNKLHSFLSILMLMIVTTTFSSCRRNGDEVWEDTKTASRHVGRGAKAISGKQGDSRAVYCRDDFYPVEDTYGSQPTYEQEYIPLPDYQNCNEVAMADVQQPRETPGDPGSSVPGINAFQDPSSNPEYSRVFKMVFFEYNSPLIKDQNDLETLRNISNYMKSHPNVYVFVEGHCDERGPEAFNLALGSRRSNSVRSLLIANGVNPDHVFTISYGKERPHVLEHHEEAWAKNRRAEFKIYQR